MTFGKVTQLRFILAICAGIVTLLTEAPASAQTAGMVSFQGLIREPDGDEIPNGTQVSLVFRIYNADTNGSVVDMDGDGTVENAEGASGAGTDAIRVNLLPTSNGLVSTKFGPVSPKSFAGCTSGASGCRWLEVTIVDTEPDLPNLPSVLSRLEMVTPPGAAEQVNKPSGNPLIIQDANGNVGIGTATPLTKLHIEDSVQGGTAFSLKNTHPGNGAYAAANFSANDAQLSLLAFSNAPGDFRADRVSLVGQENAAGLDITSQALTGDIRFFIGGYSPGTERLRINSGGNVGIGTSSPDKKLHIADSPGEPGIRLTRLTTGKEYELEVESDDSLRLGNKNAVDLVITSTGNFGIGTATPSSLLHLRSTTEANPPQITLQDPANRTLLLRAPGSVGNAVFGTTTNHDLNLITGNTTRIYVSSAGGVGVGTNTPQRGLHVRGANAGGGLMIEDFGLNGDAQVAFRRSDGAGDPDMYLTYWGQQNANTLALTDGNGRGMHVISGGNVRVGEFVPANFAGSARFAVMDGNVGIGTTFPQVALDVSMPVSTSPHIRINGTDIPGGGGAIDLGTAWTVGTNISVGDGLEIISASVPVMYVTPSPGGNVGIGTTSPTAKLHVNGSIIASGCTGCSSDQRLKMNVTTVATALSKLLSLRGVWFQWKDPAKHGDEARRQMGMIAQEVEKVLPEWVITDKSGYRYLNTNGFPALAVEAMREMKTENDALKSHVSDLEKRLARLEAALTHKSTTGAKPAKGE